MSKVVLGGGLSGLSAAYYLTKKFPSNQKISLFESSLRTGGWIKSNLQKNNIIFEQGLRTIRPRGAPGQNTLQLIDELGLSNLVIPIHSNHPAAKNRLIYAKNSLNLLPSSIMGLLRKQNPFSKPLLFHLLNDVRAPRKIVKDESIYDFIHRRFGHEVADYLISPLICGICAGNAKEISVNFLLKQLFQYEQQHGSITRGIINNALKSSSNKNQQPLNELNTRAQTEKWNVYSFKDGCETLPISLTSKIRDNGVAIKLDSKCSAINFEDNKVRLQFPENSQVFDHLLSCIPASNLGALLHKQHPDLAILLENLTKNVSVVVINLLFDKDLIKEKGFGFLVAPKEKLPILGVIYDSCCFPKDDDSTVLTVMMGGYWFEEHFGKDHSEKDLLNIALKHLKQILKIEDDPLEFKVNVLKQCLPQYVVGHNENLERIIGYIKRNKLPISLCGASYYGVGVNDVILSAKNAVDDLN